MANQVISLADYISYAIGIAGIVVSVVFYRRSKTKKSLVFKSQSWSVIRHESLENANARLLLGQKPVASLAYAQVLVWNAGNSTLTLDDFGPHSGPQIRFITFNDLYSNAESQFPQSPPRVARFRLDAVSHPSNVFQAAIPPDDHGMSSLELHFDHLAPGDGAALSFLADSGPNRNEVIAVVEGRTKDGKQVSLWTGSRWGALFTAILFVLCIATSELDRYIEGTKYAWLLTPTVAFLAVYLALTFILRNRFEFGAVPRALRQAYESPNRALWSPFHSPTVLKVRKLKHLRKSMDENVKTNNPDAQHFGVAVPRRYVGWVANGQLLGP